MFTSPRAIYKTQAFARRAAFLPSSLTCTCQTCFVRLLRFEDFPIRKYSSLYESIWQRDNHRMQGRNHLSKTSPYWLKFFTCYFNFKTQAHSYKFWQPALVSIDFDTWTLYSCELIVCNRNTSKIQRRRTKWRTKSFHLGALLQPTFRVKFNISLFHVPCARIESYTCARCVFGLIFDLCIKQLTSSWQRHGSFGGKTIHSYSLQRTRHVQAADFRLEYNPLGKLQTHR